MLKSIPSEVSINSTLVFNIIDETCEVFGVCTQNLVMLISDAEIYIIEAGNILKSRNKVLVHIQSIAHCIYSFAMHIRAAFSNIDRLISSMKMMTHKNRDKQSLVGHIGPLHPSLLLDG